MKEEQELLQLGIIERGHGLKGAVILRLFNEENSVLKERKPKLLLISKNDKKKYELQLKEITFGNKVIVSFENINSLNDIEPLLPCDVFIRRKDLPLLPQGTYYIQDAIGLKVFSQERKYLGELKEFYSNGAQLVAVIIEQKNKIEIPWVKEFLIQFDWDKKEVMVHAPEYLQNS